MGAGIIKCVSAWPSANVTVKFSVFSKHCKSLSRTSLTVGKYRSIKALGYSFDYRRDKLIDLFLSAMIVEYAIIG